MKWRSINYLLGSVLLYLAFAMLIPLLWAMWEKGAERLDFSMVVVLTICTAWLLLRAGEPPAELRREEVLLCDYSLAACVLFSACLTICRQCATMIDAYFEAMSGFTAVQRHNFCGAAAAVILLWRALRVAVAWVLSFYLLLFSHPRVSGALLVQAETPGPLTQTAAPGCQFTRCYG